MSQTTYFVIDHETNGTDVCTCSALALACVAFRETGGIVSAFSRNMVPLSGSGDAKTMAWWKQFPDQYKMATENPKPPSFALAEFAGWVNWCLSVGGEAVLCATPAAFDVPILRRYWKTWLDPRPWPFGHRSLDIRSYVTAAKRVPFNEPVCRTDLFEKSLRKKPVKHVALDDALVAAYTLMDALHGCDVPVEKTA